MCSCHVCGFSAAADSQGNHSGAAYVQKCMIFRNVILMPWKDQPHQSVTDPAATSESSCLIKLFDLTNFSFVKPKSPAASLAALK